LLVLMKWSVDRVGRSLREFPPQFWLLTAGILVYSTGVDMSSPYETLLLTNNLHLSIGIVGLVVGLAGLFGLPFQILGGTFADRVGRRGVLLLAACGSSTLYIGLALAHGLAAVAVVVTIEAVFGWSMFLTATNAMVADLTSEPRRAEGFAILRTAINASMVIGPLIALIFVGKRADFRPLFAVGGAVCLLFFVMAVAAIRETKPTTVRRSPIGKGIRHVVRDRHFIAFSAIALLPLYGYGQILSTFPVALQRTHGISAGQWTRLLIVYALGLTVLQFLVIRLTRRWNPFRLLAVASAALGLGIGLAPLLAAGWLTVVLVLLASVGVVLFVPVASTVVASFAPVDLRGRYMGAWTIVLLGGYDLGPLCGGFTMDALGARVAFLIVAAAGLAGAVCFPWLSHHALPASVSSIRPPL
jgi:MFS family permease